MSTDLWEKTFENVIESLLLFAQFLRVSTPHIAKTDYRITPKGKYEFGGEEIGARRWLLFPDTISAIIKPPPNLVVFDPLVFGLSSDISTRDSFAYKLKTQLIALCSKNFQNVKLRLDFVEIWSF